MPSRSSRWRSLAPGLAAGSARWRCARAPAQARAYSFIPRAHLRLISRAHLRWPTAGHGSFVALSYIRGLPFHADDGSKALRHSRPAVVSRRPSATQLLDLADLVLTHRRRSSAGASRKTGAPSRSSRPGAPPGSASARRDDDRGAARAPPAQRDRTDSRTADRGRGSREAPRALVL